MTFFNKSERNALSYMDRMKTKTDSRMGPHIYSQRLRMIEPVVC
ncbi:MAG: hypothetical protein V7739_18455 [Motiliproteus sp.]